MLDRWKIVGMRRLLILAALLLGGCLGNYFGISLYFGSDFLFGSAAVLLVLYYYGLPLGLIVGAAAGSVTYFSWGHPYAAVTFTLEAAFVGSMLHRTSRSLLVLDGLFWLTAGIPIVVLVYGFILDMGATATTFMVLKQAINGVFNALVASIVVNYSSLHKLIEPRSNQGIVPLRETLFNALVAFVLLPSLFILFQESGEYARTTERATIEGLKDLGVRLSSHLKVWHTNRLSSVEELAAVAEESGVEVSMNLQHDLEIMVKSDRNFVGFFVADAEGMSVAHSSVLSRDGLHMSGLNFAGRAYFQETRATGYPVISDVIEGYGDLPARVITLSVPIMKQGKFAGCATGGLDLQRIQELISLSPEERGNVLRNITITGRDGRVITSSIRGRESPQYFKPEQNVNLRKIEESVFIYTPDEYKLLPTVSRWKASFYTIERRISDDIPWTLIIEYPVAPLQENLFRKQSQVFLRAACMAMLALLFAVVLSRRVSCPLTDLSAAATDLPYRIANGLPVEWPGSSTTEIHTLAHSFQIMCDLLQQNFLELSERENQLRRLNEELQLEIRERNLAEEALRKSEERFRLATLGTNDGIWDWDLSTDHVYYSPRWKMMLGYGEEELEEHLDTWKQLVHPDDKEPTLEKVRDLVEGRAEKFEVELRMRHRDGHFLDILTRAFMVRSSEGVGIRLVGTHLDITDRNRAVAVLFESEQRFRQFAENVDSGIWIADRSTGSYVFSNPAYETIWGQPCQSGKRGVASFLESVVPEDRKRVLDRFFRQGKGIFEVDEYAIRRPDGSVRYIRDRAFPLRDENGKIRYVAGIAKDITERKVAESERARLEAQMQQAQKMEALGTLAGGIAHDFNNILGIISGFTEMIDSEAGKDAAIREYTEEVMKAVRRARDLVKQILTFSRHNEQERFPVQINIIVKEALKMLRASIPATVEIQVDVNSDALVLADPTQIHQVLLNLCTNAAHAMQKQGGVLRVSLIDVCMTSQASRQQCVLSPGLYVVLVVKDSGHGIDPSILHRIFDPFFTTKGPSSGTGLGLSVVDGIAKSHGGMVEVESHPGDGATFRVFFPVTEESSEPPAIRVDPLAVGHERILVVDDEPALGAAMQLMLTGLGYEVECGNACTDALATFHHSLDDKPFDLVITDMTMPCMTGEELALELREIQPCLPVIVCTGYSEKLNAEKAKSLGFQGFLMKPVVVSDLAELVRGVLDGARVPHQAILESRAFGSENCLKD